ncbi:MAG: GntR family transcriptional regulator [Betaproteobacteria bacterium]
MTKLESVSLVQQAADVVRRRILSGEMKPGDRLREEQLARELGISRPPLREAFRLLQSEGLIESLNRRGFIVAPLREQDAWEIATLRSALERTAMELALPVAPKNLLECQEAIKAMREAAKANDSTAFVETSFQFHLSVVKLAGHNRLTNAYKSLYLQMQLCMALNVRSRKSRLGESLLQNVKRHEEMLKFIKKGDLNFVLKAFEDHGERSYLAEVFSTDMKKLSA